MQPDEYTTTDPIQEEEPAGPYGFWARLVGLPVLEQRLLKRIEDLVSNSADIAALQEALTEARSADVTVDNIQPGPLTQSKSKKGTKP